MTRSNLRSIRVSSLVAVVVLQTVLVNAAPDDPSLSINLSGIPGAYSFGRVSKLSSGDLWIVGGNGNAQRISKKGDVLRVTVAQVDLNGVFFLNANSGWIIGENGKIFHTDDGGLIWNAQASGVKENLQAITCTSESRCWVVGENGVILTTHDRGNHWKRISSGVSKLLLAVSFVNRQTGWAVGEDGLIVRTTNAGKTWRRQQATIVLFPRGPSAKPTNLEAVKFIDESRGWVAGAGGIAGTWDGGKTWKVKEIEAAAFIGLVSQDLNTVWAINRDGSNYLTKNGGQDWEPINPPKSSAKRNACCS